MSDGNHGDDGISDAEVVSLWTRVEQQNRAHELKRRREEREREDAWQASFPDLDSLRTPHDLLAECQRIRGVLIEDRSNSAQRTVAHADFVVRRLWDAMRSIGGSVPDQPTFADCTVAASWACRLLGDYRRRDALHRAVDDVTRWCEARNGDDAPGRSRQTDSGKGRSVSNNPSELVSDDGPLRMPRTEAERANNTPVGDMGGHSADSEPLNANTHRANVRLGKRRDPGATPDSETADQAAELPLPGTAVNGPSPETETETVGDEALARYRRGPEVRHDRARKRSELIDQAMSVGITETQAIFEFVKNEDPSLVLSGETEIKPDSMMKDHARKKKGRENCNPPG